jgi:hypothetical protein
MTCLTLTGPPKPRRGEERFFERRQAVAACAWALAGGVAIHGDLDGQQDGGRPLRVLGQLPVLLAWATQYGPEQSWQPSSPPSRTSTSGPCTARLPRQGCASASCSGCAGAASTSSVVSSACSSS